MTVPSGGPSTINGIIYQMLWSLMRAGKLSVFASEVDNDELSSATIVLEPRSGGDIIVHDGFTTVEQIKTRSSEGTWPIREIIEKVLPDLYLAACTLGPHTKYRFVTDGQMGQWEHVHTFFRSLKDRNVADENPLGHLDNLKEVAFQRHTTKKSNEFWGNRTYTEQRVVERIIEEVRKRREVRDEELLKTQQNVSRMLANLEFVWCQSADNLLHELESCLAAVVNIAEKIPNIRRDLAMDLAEKATAGNVTINPEEFFREHGLDAIPLSNWGRIRHRAAQVLGSELEIRRYLPQSDVRAEESQQFLDSWSDTTPIVVVEGETGYGKSWQLFALAHQQQHAMEIPVYLEARGEVGATLSHAGRLISERVWGQDQPLSLERVAERRKSLHPHEGWWLTLLIDNVQNPEEAKQLTLQPWEDWGIRVAIGCHPSISAVIQQSAQDRAKSISISEFSVEQTQRFLEHNLPGGWPEIPQDMAQMLRRPLLAHLYVDAVADRSWSPVNEYELYAAYWKRLQQGSSILNPLDEARLKILAQNFIDGKAYPWTASQLLEIGLGRKRCQVPFTSADCLDSQIGNRGRDRCCQRPPAQIRT